MVFFSGDDEYRVPGRTKTIGMIHFLVLCLFLQGLEALAAGGVGDDITAMVEEFEKRSMGDVAVSYVGIRRSDMNYSLDGEKMMVPASNQKLLTSVFAISSLKADFHFSTKIHFRGKDLIVESGWDPTLGDPVIAGAEKKSIYHQLDRWAGAVRRKAGNVISGDIILTSRISTTAFRPPDWPRRHYNKWYGAPIADLNFHDNCYDVTFVKSGGKIVPAVMPSSRYIRLINEVRPGKKHIWALKSTRDESRATITGTYSSVSPDPVSVPVNDPTLLLARVFADRLAVAGVKVAGGIRKVESRQIDLGRIPPLIETRTPLTEVLARANRRILNLAAECMFLRAGDGTWKGSAKQMTETLVKSYGFDADKLRVSDGCGLSGENRVTTKMLAGMLRFASGGEIGRMLLASLPLSGQKDTTMRRRMTAKPYAGRVAGKTGYISGVVTLSGYILDKNGKPAVAFSILGNDVRGVVEAKKLADRICMKLVDHIDR